MPPLSQDPNRALGLAPNAIRVRDDLIPLVLEQQFRLMALLGSAERQTYVAVVAALRPDQAANLPAVLRFDSARQIAAGGVAVMNCSPSDSRRAMTAIGLAREITEGKPGSIIVMEPRILQFLDHYFDSDRAGHLHSQFRDCLQRSANILWWQLSQAAKSTTAWERRSGDVPEIIDRLANIHGSQTLLGQRALKFASASFLEAQTHAPARVRTACVDLLEIFRAGADTQSLRHFREVVSSITLVHPPSDLDALLKLDALFPGDMHPLAAYLSEDQQRRCIEQLVPTTPAGIPLNWRAPRLLTQSPDGYRPADPGPGDNHGLEDDFFL